MELYDKIQELYKKADEIAISQKFINRQIDEAKRDLEKYRPEMTNILATGSEKLKTAISDIPKLVHVKQEYGLNQKTQILGWSILFTILLTAAMIIWLMPKAELEYIQYQQNKIQDQEEMLEFFKDRNPKTLKAWNEQNQIK
jgi:S-adenosylhomocysteine hydrolase